MQFNDRLSEFILELINYADNEDIDTLLGYFESSLTESIQSEYIKWSNSKIRLIEYLFKYINGYIYNNIESIPELYNYKKQSEHLPIVFSHSDLYDSFKYMTPLYLHLYALCECYYSYPLADAEKGLLAKFISNIEQSKGTKEKKKINTLKDNSRTKFLKLLINSYKEKKFYYLFYKNTLLKLKIEEKSTEHIDNNKQKYCEKTYIYKHIIYSLEDRDGVTRIINKKLKIDKPLNSILVRFDDTDIENSIKRFNEEMTKTISLNQSINFHKQITNILSEKRPNSCSQRDFELLNNRCKKLLEELEQLKMQIGYDETNDYILTIRDIDFEKELFSFEQYRKLSMKEVRYKIKSKLNKLIKNIKKEISSEHDNEPYIKILEKVKNIEKLLSAILGKS